MLYIDTPSREKFKNDFDRFIAGALTESPVHNADR